MEIRQRDSSAVVSESRCALYLFYLIRVSFPLGFLKCACMCVLGAGVNPVSDPGN